MSTQENQTTKDGPAETLALAIAWVPVSSANCLVALWHERAIRLNNLANDAYGRADYRQAHEYRLKAESLTDCADELHRETVAAILRQRAPNTETKTRKHESSTIITGRRLRKSL